MGIFDNIIGGVTNRVKSDVEYRASSGISDAITKGAGKVVEGDKTPRCPKCKKAIADPSQKFCPECGAKLVASCSKCQQDYAFGTKFCTNCGGALK